MAITCVISKPEHSRSLRNSLLTQSESEPLIHSLRNIHIANKANSHAGDASEKLKTSRGGYTGRERTQENSLASGSFFLYSLNFVQIFLFFYFFIFKLILFTCITLTTNKFRLKSCKVKSHLRVLKFGHKTQNRQNNKREKFIFRKKKKFLEGITAHFPK